MTSEHRQRTFLDAFLPIHARLERYVRAMTRDDDEALQRLSHDDREVLVLYELADLPLQEVAALQHITLAAVKQRASRARRRLADLLRDGTRAPGSTSAATSSLLPGLQEE